MRAGLLGIGRWFRCSSVIGRCREVHTHTGSSRSARLPAAASDRPKAAAWSATVAPRRTSAPARRRAGSSRPGSSSIASAVQRKSTTPASRPKRRASCCSGGRQRRSASRLASMGASGAAGSRARARWRCGRGRCADRRARGRRAPARRAVPAAAPAATSTHGSTGASSRASSLDRGARASVVIRSWRRGPGPRQGTRSRRERIDRRRGLLVERERHGALALHGPCHAQARDTFGACPAGA
jgi:hypothetical protein